MSKDLQERAVLRGKDFASKRAEVCALCSALFGPPLPVPHVEDIEVPGNDGTIPVRVYRPESEGLLPIMVYYHGGGWCYGSIDSHDSVCRAYAIACNAVVVSVGYRLAPEHPFPAGLDDCYAATAWVSKNAEELGGDASTLAVAGDSAGGNLAAAVALKARGKQAEGGPNIRFQVHVCSVLGHHSRGTPSYAEFGGEGSMPSRANMQEMFGHYAPREADAHNPLVCPLNSEDLTGLPPALILTAEKDLLRDEAEEYALRLQAAGVDATVKRFKGAAHVGMSSPEVCAVDNRLSTDLINVLWRHALHCGDPLLDNSVAKL